MPRFSDRTVDVANHAIDALPRHPRQSTAPLRALRCGDRAPTRRQRLQYLIALLMCKSWLWLVLSLMLSSQVVAGELSFTVRHLEQVQAFETHDEFQLTPLAHTPELNIRLNKLQGRIKRHAHPQSSHFLYLIKGQIELMVGDETTVVGAGDLVTIPRQVPHAMKRIGTLEVLFLDVASPPDVGDVVWYE
jgi:quercetin dioxygenase-like cupin family protein